MNNMYTEACGRPRQSLEFHGVNQINIILEEIDHN